MKFWIVWISSHMESDAGRHLFPSWPQFSQKELSVIGLEGVNSVTLNSWGLSLAPWVRVLVGRACVFNSHHSFSGALAAGDFSIAHQLLHWDLLIGEWIAAGALGINCIWKINHKEKAF
jgi:hypothetical protein